MFLCRPEDGQISLAETCRLLVCFLDILICCCVRRLQPPEYRSSTAVWIIQILLIGSCFVNLCPWDDSAGYVVNIVCALLVPQTIHNYQIDMRYNIQKKVPYMYV
jgi:hypothetical protein